MKKFFILFYLCVSGMLIFAQSSITYEIEPAIDNLQKDYVAAWQKIAETNGYRIQILAASGSSAKARVESEFQNFETQFPEIPAYLSFVEPNFRIRVGNFYTRLQAYKVMLSIQWAYPDAYITSDKIQYSDN